MIWRYNHFIMSTTIPIPICAICRECMVSNQDSINGRPITLECGHKFHYACIRYWFNTSMTCPLCRAAPNYFPIPIPLRNGSMIMGYGEYSAIEDNDDESVPATTDNEEVSIVFETDEDEMEALVAHEDFNTIMNELGYEG